MLQMQIYCYFENPTDSSAVYQIGAIKHFPVFPACIDSSECLLDVCKFPNFIFIMIHFVEFILVSAHHLSHHLSVAQMMGKIMSLSLQSFLKVL